MILQQAINGISLGLVYATFSLGLTLTMSVMQVLNMAHGAILTWGTLIGLYVAVSTKASLPFVFLVAMVVSGAISTAIDYLVFKPLRARGDREWAGLIASTGLSLILVRLAQIATEADLKRFPMEIVPQGIYELGPVTLTATRLMLIIAAVVLTTLLTYWVHRTRMGKAMQAVAFRDRTASLFGINTNKLFAVTFFISGALAGAAGVLLGLAFNVVHFYMGEPLLIKAFAIIILGGIGSIPGALLGGVVLGLGEVFAVAFISSSYRDALTMSLILVLLMVRPSGLFGSKEGA